MARCYISKKAWQGLNTARSRFIPWPRRVLEGERMGCLYQPRVSWLSPCVSCRESCRTRAAMSEARHALVRGPSFIGLGKRPSLQPCHHALLHTGMSSRTCGKRRKDSSANFFMKMSPVAVKGNTVALFKFGLLPCFCSQTVQIVLLTELFQ